MPDDDIHSTESAGGVQHRMQEKYLRDDIRNGLNPVPGLVRRSRKVFLEIADQVKAAAGCDDCQKKAKVRTFAPPDEGEVPDGGHDGRQDDHEHRQA